MQYRQIKQEIAMAKITLDKIKFEGNLPDGVKHKVMVVGNYLTQCLDELEKYVFEEMRIVLSEKEVGDANVAD